MINFKLNSNAWHQWILKIQKMDFDLPFFVHFSIIKHQQNVVAIFIFIKAFFFFFRGGAMGPFAWSLAPPILHLHSPLPLPKK